MSNVESKKQLRQLILVKRNQLADRDAASSSVLKSITELNHYQTSQTILFYVNARSEVGTLSLLRSELKSEKTVVVPYCDGDILKLSQLENEVELSPGMFGILEPSSELKSSATRKIEPAAIDFVLVPGAVFDRQGYRIGYGKGYYDRLIPLLRDDCVKVGLAFECQLIDEVPREDHDQKLDYIVTEKRVLAC